jgi:molybdenum cofactor guanylyltransferase
VTATAHGLVPDFDTIILAGGRAVRMAGADKPALAVGETSMLVSVARAATAAGTGRLIIVGPRREGAVLDALAAETAGVPGGLAFVSEEPPGGGPVPALRMGLAEVTAPWLALLAADLPFLRGRQIRNLLAEGLAAGAAGAVLTDGDARAQWLAGGWQADAVRAALLTYDGSSLHGLLAPLDPVLAPLADPGPGPAPWLDCDTPADLAAARRAWRAFDAGQNGEA